MYKVIQLVIFIVILAVSIIIFRKIKFNKIAIKIIITIVAISVAEVIFSIVSCNLISFNSAMEAYQYYEGPNCYVSYMAKGENSVVIAKQHGTTTEFRTIVKENNRWKVGQDYYLENVKTYSTDKSFILIKKCVNTNEYFIFIDVTDESINVSDNCNTVFSKYTSTGGGYYPVTYYGLINNYNENYKITVDGFVLDKNSR